MGSCDHLERKKTISKQIKKKKTWNKFSLDLIRKFKNNKQNKTKQSIDEMRNKYLLRKIT